MAEKISTPITNITSTEPEKTITPPSAYSAVSYDGANPEAAYPNLLDTAPSPPMMQNPSELSITTSNDGATPEASYVQHPIAENETQTQNDDTESQSLQAKSENKQAKTQEVFSQLFTFEYTGDPTQDAQIRVEMVDMIEEYLDSGGSIDDFEIFANNSQITPEFDQAIRMLFFEIDFVGDFIDWVSNPETRPDEWQEFIVEDMQDYVITFDTPISRLRGKLPPEHHDTFDQLLEYTIEQRKQKQQELERKLLQLFEVENDRDEAVEMDAAEIADLIENLDEPDEHPREKRSWKETLYSTWLDILPTLIQIDGALSLLTGKQQEIGVLFRQVEELKNGPETPEKILRRLKVPPEIIGILQERKLSRTFFDFFQDEPQKLLAFFEEITASSGSMFLFLEKMDSQDLRSMIEQKQIPTNSRAIPLKESELAMILSKLRPYERAKLGIDENEPKMKL